MSKLTYSVSVVALLSVTFFWSGAVQAQDTQDSNALLDEVIVTATKKADGENQQDTEIAITAFGNEQLEAFQVRNISDLSFKIPNVQLDEVGTVKGTANFAVRGLGVNSSIPSIDPAVGVFVDGIYLGINAGVVFDTFDLASVETLRGPQGVLFGRNVTGGAVLVNTGNPTDELHVKTKFAVESGLRGTGENYYATGVISGPLTEGLKGKIGIYYNNDLGWHENLLDNSNFGESETLLLRGALEYDGLEGVNILGKLEYGDTNGDGPAGQSHQNGSGVNSFATNLGGGDLSQTFDRNSFDFAVNTRGFQESEWINFSLKTDIDVAFGDGTITNIFGFRDFEQNGLSDIDAGVLSVFDAFFNIDQDQISNELRYNGRFLDDRLDFTAGLFYFTQDLAYEEQRRVGGGPLNFDGGGILDHETFGIFGAGEYAVTDRLSLNAGLRFTDETKVADIAQIEISADNSPCFLFNRGAGDRTCDVERFPTFNTSNLSPKIGFGYEVQDNLRLYGHWSRAFRAGGFNLRNTEDPMAALVFGPGPFEDERIDNFEIGFKSEPILGARVNGSAFFNLVDDLQREVNVAGGTAVVQQVITNAADAEIYGFELDALWPVTNNFILNGSIGVVEGNFTDVTINLNTPDAAGLALPAGDDDLELDIPRLSPFTASAGFTYFRDVGVGKMTVNGNYSHRDQAAFTDNNLGFINAQDRFDASIGLDFVDSGFNVTVYGKNLSNEVLHGGDTQLSNGTFSPLAKGRVIGVELNYEY